MGKIAIDVPIAPKPRASPIRSIALVSNAASRTEYLRQERARAGDPTRRSAQESHCSSRQGDPQKKKPPRTCGEAGRHGIQNQPAERGNGDAQADTQRNSLRQASAAVGQQRG